MVVLAGMECAPVFVNQPVETRVGFLNFDTDAYLMFGIRESAEPGFETDYRYTPLLPPGGVVRENFSTLIDVANPSALDVQVFVYRRVNHDVPIGLDEGEEVEPVPMAAGEVFEIPAGSVQTLETFTIVNWNAPDGMARVKFAQCSMVDQVIRDAGLFESDDAAWEIEGADVALAETAPQPMAEVEPITGRVVLVDGSGVPDVLVLLHPRFRNTLECTNPTREGDAGYGDVIDFAETDADGYFTLNRPAGVYQLLFASDDHAFRPGIMEIETPLEDIRILAEPLP